MKFIILSLFVGLLVCPNSNAQTVKTDSSFKQCFVETSLLSLANFSEFNPNYYQLNLGINLSLKDAVIIEAWTFRHKSSLGIPYGSSFTDSLENYPGHVREKGIGITYQRFFLKNLFSNINVTPFFLGYYDTENIKIQKGFRLFTSLRVGYQFNFFNKRFFVKPTLAVNYWSVNTNIPESFKEFETKWPNYFIFDPNINIGIVDTPKIRTVSLDN